jgi:hypothetical protein
MSKDAQFRYKVRTDDGVLPIYPYRYINPLVVKIVASDADEAVKLAKKRTGRSKAFVMEVEGDE